MRMARKVEPHTTYSDNKARGTSTRGVSHGDGAAAETVGLESFMDFFEGKKRGRHGAGRLVLHPRLWSPRAAAPLLRRGAGPLRLRVPAGDACVRRPSGSRQASRPRAP